MSLKKDFGVYKSSNGCSIEEYKGQDSTVEIPDHFGDKPVTGINGKAFAGRDYVDRIILPDTLEYAYNFSFVDHNSPVFNRFRDALYLGSSDNPYYLFVGPENNEIDSIDMHQDTKVIASSAFLNNTYLKHCHLAEGIKMIPSFAFSGCTELMDVSIPESVEIIEAAAFSGCRNLDRLILPDNIRSFGNSTFFTFNGCKKAFGLYDDMYFLGSRSNRYLVLVGCHKDNKKKDIAVPEGTRFIFDYIFGPEIVSITVPDSVTYIGDSAIYECDKRRFTMMVNEGSYAEEYAKRFRYKFKSIDGTKVKKHADKDLTGEPKKKSGKGRPETGPGQFVIRYRSLNEYTFNWSVWRYDKRVFDDYEDAVFFAGQVNTPDSAYETAVEVLDHNGEVVWVTTL